MFNFSARKEFMLDSCTVEADPPLNLREEVLLTPHDLIRQLQLESSLTNEELQIKSEYKVILSFNFHINI